MPLLSPRRLPACAFLLACIFSSIASTQLFGQSVAPAAADSAASPAAQLRISGDVAKPLSLSPSDLAQMPRKTLSVMNEHDKKQEVYEGVPLSDLLASAGVPQHGKLKGAAMATYVEVGASDGYRVIFSLAELDSDFLDSDVLVADKLDGQPLAAAGPLRLIVPHDKRPGRWVRNLQWIKVVAVPVAK